MGNDTGISWCDDSRNLWWGCFDVNAQCDHCYARTFDNRLGGNHWLNKGPRLIQMGVWKAFEKAQKQAFEANTIRTQFVQSMGDIFERSMPTVNRKGIPQLLTTGDLRKRYFEQVIPNTPNLYHLLLTKRPQNIERMIPTAWLDNPPKNVMYGCSVGSGNTEADKSNLWALLTVPGRHFVSIEPMLGPVDLTDVGPRGVQWDALTGEFEGVRDKMTTNKLDWVIVGGESGGHARPMNPQWARQLRDDCRLAKVPFFFKQWGEFVQTEIGKTYPATAYTIYYDRSAKARTAQEARYINDKHQDCVIRLGRQQDPKTLDGVTHHEFPNFSAFMEN